MSRQLPPNTAQDPGLWCQGLTDLSKRNPHIRSALFLDRDGVLVEEVNYLHRIADMRVIPGAPAMVRSANERGLPVVIVTNQSGVGRGYYDWDSFAALQAALITAFAAEGAHFDMVMACAYHADGQSPYNVPDHPWRKPRPGMLHMAADLLGFDLGSSWIIGDSASDIEAGRNAGLAGALHVETGHGRRDRDKALALAVDAFTVHAIGSVADAAGLDFLRHATGAPC